MSWFFKETKTKRETEKIINDLKQDVERYKRLFESEGSSKDFWKKRYDSVLDEKVRTDLKNAELRREINMLKLKNEVYERFLNTVYINVDFPKENK